ncbi:hypothetical protein, conserved [Entamoeba histolytica]
MTTLKDILITLAAYEIDQPSLEEAIKLQKQIGNLIPSIHEEHQKRLIKHAYWKIVWIINTLAPWDNKN